MVTEGELPYWHLEHEVLLTEAEANVGDGAVEEAGGSKHQHQVKVPREGSLHGRRSGEVGCQRKLASLEGLQCSFKEFIKILCILGQTFCIV